LERAGAEQAAVARPSMVTWCLSRRQKLSRSEAKKWKTTAL